MAPVETRQFKDNAIAWARLYYCSEADKFKGRLEIHQDFMQICMSVPDNVDEGDLVGPEIERDAMGTLDQLEAEAYSKARLF